jgi:VanZ family protein
VSLRRPVMKPLSQILSWVLVVGILILSIVPPGSRVVTDLPRLLEHLAVFLLAGLAFVFGYPGHYLFQCVTLSLFAAAIELLQMWVPGRHARLSDFIAGFAGVILGIVLGHLSTKFAWGKQHEEK